MASSSVQDDLRHAKRMVERAAKEQSAAGPARRAAFEGLIDLAHSSHPHLKSYAADHIHVFFSDFPDMEEVAINAVYDLCEDPDAKVRMDGYHAVTQVSAVQHKWVKRNADVLVQLLQSNEPEEVALVKLALLRHLDMDPPVTLGVLCDQIVPPDEDLDDDERQTRERLRSLVLSFLATDSVGTIQKHTDPPGSEAENILVSHLLLAITRLQDTADVDVIVKDILLRLPCCLNGSRSDALLQVLLDKAATLIQTPSSDPEQLKTALHYLSVAQVATVNIHATSPVKLLQFYIGYLTRKLVLQKFRPEDRIQLISWVMDALSVSERESTTQPQQIAQLRRQIVDASSILLEILFDSKLYRDDLWSAVKSILHAINTRKESENWIVPPYLIISVSKFLQISSQGQTQEAANDIQGLIKSLVPGEQASSSQAPTPPQEIKPLVKNGITSKRPAHLPRRPATTLPPGPLPTDLDQPMTLSVATIATEQPCAAMQDAAGTSSFQHLLHVSSVPTSPKRSGSGSEDALLPRSSKRVKSNSRGQQQDIVLNAAMAPSLLSRLADTTAMDAGGGSGSGGHGHLDRTGKRRKKGRIAGSVLGLGKEEPEPSRHPSTGYSIKGAATGRSQQQQQQQQQQQRNGSAGTESSSSLLDRMRKEGDSD